MYAVSTSRADARHRHPATQQPAQPVDARAELQHLFKAYDAACLDFDADALAGFYDLPCMLSTPDGNGSFTSRGELRAALARHVMLYRQQGLVTASLASLTLTALSDDFAQGQAVWSFSNARGVDVMSFACAYTLRRAQGRWRIVHAVTLDDAEKLGARKKPVNILTLR